MASNQQEIEVLDNWEDIEETDVLEKNFSRLMQSNRNLESNCNGTPINIILSSDDALRSQYVPPEPTVKILKRPTKSTAVTNDSKAFQPKKTLQQREQEYAEARLRILGQAHSPERVEDKVSYNIQNKPKSETESIVRQPKGPDGTKGFNIRR